MDARRTWNRRDLIVAAGRATALASLVSPFELLGRAGPAFAEPASRVRTFVTRQDLRPPRLEVVTRGKPAGGLLFLAPSSGPGQRGVMIADSGGEPIWFHPTTPHTAMNFRAARYRGKPVLTWWEGKAHSGLGTGTHVILDDSYRVVARVTAGHHRPSDLHEFLITPEDTALITSYEVRTADLTTVGGPKSAPVIGGLVQELELPSGRVLFEWRSLDHVDIAESHAIWVNHPFDYFHINSIDLSSDGGLLVSARNTWAVYKISRRTGKVRWRLGGKKSDFKMEAGAVFAWQHDARHQAHDRISVFDDGGAPQVEPQSRGIVIQLDERTRSARLLRKYTHHPGRIQSRFMGNLQMLDNGNVLIGWGSEPLLTEFNAAGDVVLDVHLPPGGQNYRALKFPWHGRPTVRPKVAYRHERGQGHLYASWNGATEVAAWRLESGPTPGALHAETAVRRAGFETVLVVPPGHRWGRAVALDASGHVLQKSYAVRV